MQEGVSILTVTERGYGKRTPLDEYRLQGRAGKGIIDIKTGGRNGNVVAMLQVRDGDDILVVTTKGKMIRFHVGRRLVAGAQHDGACASSTSRPTTGSARSRASSRRAPRRSKRSSAVLDVRLIREQPEAVARGARRARAGAELVRDIVALDAERRRLIKEAEDLKALRNRASEAIGQAKRRGEDASAEMARMREVGERIKTLDDEAEGGRRSGSKRSLLQLPNLPHPSVPPGKREDDNVEVRRWGEPRTFAFAPKPHEEIGAALGSRPRARGEDRQGALRRAVGRHGAARARAGAAHARPPHPRARLHRALGARTS